MAADWEVAGSSWNKFLEDMEGARAELGCSLSNAWFRGHRDGAWELTPSILRSTRKKHGNLSSDDRKKVKELDQFLSDKKKRALTIKSELKSLKVELRESVSSSERISELELRRRIEALDQEAVFCSNDIRRTQLSINNIRATEAGEYDAFVDFRFRSGEQDGSSWVTLAKMQHYGIPTRLLDWTETLIIAVYFALGSYISELEHLWAIDRSTVKRERDAYPLRYHDLSHLPEPAVWVLNPYHLSRQSTGRNVLWSPGLGPNSDYFNSFFEARSWPFLKPVPMYSPWENPRIAAQQGIFTVHGLSRTPMDDQVKSDTLKRIPMSREAATYGAKLVKTAFGLNHFALFRDLDRLGSEVTMKYLG